MKKMKKEFKSFTRNILSYFILISIMTVLLSFRSVDMPPGNITDLVGTHNKEISAEKEDTSSYLFPLWDEQVPFPSIEHRSRPERAVDILVHRADEEYRFLHDNAVVWHGETLFAAWYNCPKAEIQESSLIRGRRSHDKGMTWSEIEVIAADYDEKGIFYVPVAFLSHDSKLYAFITNMVGHDLVTRCEVFILDEMTDRWQSHGFIADKFLPNCEPVLMEDGNFIMAGRVADQFRTKPETPAVAISNGKEVTQPWTIIRLMDEKLLTYPETTVWVEGHRVTAISRDRQNGKVFTSEDYGRNWVGPFSHNLPVENSKLYAGMLSTGQRYLVWNLPMGERRNELVIGVSRPYENQLVAVWQIRHGPSEHLGTGPEWSYPYAVEHKGKLYVIYTSEKKHSAMTIIPVESLTVGKD